MHAVTTGELIFHSAFFLLFFGVPAALAWASYCERFKRFDVSALWTNHQSGKVDTLLVIVIGSWWVHTCAVILWTLSRTVQTADFTTYMGWAIPIIASLFAPRRDPPG
jgi:hypothetical protein